MKPEEALVILLATDRSPEAEGARQMLHGWDFQPTDSVAAITVLEGGVPEDERTPDAPDSISMPANRGAGAAPDSIRDTRLQWRTLEREGDPAEQILAAAQELGSNLIVVGARGMGRMRRLLVGSVALGVSRHASCSVLAVRRPFQPIRSVLVATDGSSPAHAAGQALLTLPLARRPRAHVVLVLPRPEELAGGHAELHARLQALRADAWRRQHEAAESVCTELSNRLAQAEIPSSWEVTNVIDFTNSQRN